MSYLAFDTIISAIKVSNSSFSAILANFLLSISLTQLVMGKDSAAV